MLRFLVLLIYLPIESVTPFRKSHSQEYQGYFIGPQPAYHSRQTTSNVANEKWSYSSNQQPLNYQWYWTNNDNHNNNYFPNNPINVGLDNSCGRSPMPSRFAKIMGGQDAAPNSYPWMVSLAKRSLNNLHLCGGVLITQRHVLTAAHCMEDFDGPSDLNILAGIHNINEKSHSIPAVALSVHPQYDPDSFANDVAIVTLSMPIPTNDPRIGIICLPPDDVQGRLYPPAKSSAIAIGWGSTYFGGNPSQTLKQVLLPILDATRWPCNIYVTYAQGQLCAGALQGGVDTCQADSGGPLMIENSDNRWEVVGITSFGKSCGQPNSPGIYTRVGTYKNFIRSTIGLFRNSPYYYSSTSRTDPSNKILFITFLLLLFF